MLQELEQNGKFKDFVIEERDKKIQMLSEENRKQMETAVRKRNFLKFSFSSFFFHFQIVNYKRMLDLTSKQEVLRFIFTDEHPG
jgi:hypothetical protein